MDANGRADPPGVAVLLPVKAFHLAKIRLTPALDPASRAALARSMASTVVGAAQNLPTYVVCDDDDVALWAVDAGCIVLWRPGLGLNAAVRSGVDALADLGFDDAIVAHADLPHADDLGSLVTDSPLSSIILVPDRHDDGTNVIVLPTHVAFEFTYGPQSFARHLVTAHATGLPVAVERRLRLGWDVDEPADLILPEWATP